MSASSLLQSSARLALRQSSIPALRKLRVEENDVDLVLTGAVTSYYLKQLAQETVMPFLGDRQLLNQVVVINR
jgi:hypothetical protein